MKEGAEQEETKKVEDKGGRVIDAEATRKEDEKS